MRFLADMGVSAGVVQWLRQQGHEAKHLREEGLQRLPNGDIFAKAMAESRVVLTFDLDFSEIAATARGPIVSVISFRLHNARARHVIDRLAAILPHVSSALEEGAIVSVEEGRHRVRHLPIGHSDHFS